MSELSWADWFNYYPCSFHISKSHPFLSASIPMLLVLCYSLSSNSNDIKIKATSTAGTAMAVPCTFWQSN